MSTDVPQPQKKHTVAPDNFHVDGGAAGTSGAETDGTDTTTTTVSETAAAGSGGTVSPDNFHVDSSRS